MTIAVAVRTGSAVVFAADSKVTTSGLIGLEEDGEPRWMEQTYDNATKVVHDPSQTMMAMVAGHANIGQETAMDFIMSHSVQRLAKSKNQDQTIGELIDSMARKKKEHWEKTKAEPKDWPGPTLLLATASTTENIPRIWKVDLQGEGSKIDEILRHPNVWLEGSYNEVFGLIYGYSPEILGGLTNQLKIETEKVTEALQNLRVPRPVDKLSLWSIPIQDAIDLAVFLAKVQVEMDRFLPGQPACGGAIDVMVLRMVPECGILTFPGKTLRHPNL